VKFLSRFFRRIRIREKIVLTGVTIIVLVLLADTLVVVQKSRTWFIDEARDRLQTAADITLIDIANKSDLQSKLIDLIAKDETMIFNVSIVREHLSEDSGEYFDDRYTQLTRSLADRLKRTASIESFDLLQIRDAEGRLLAFYDRSRDVKGWLVGTTQFSGQTGGHIPSRIDLRNPLLTTFEHGEFKNSETQFRALNKAITLSTGSQIIESEGDESVLIGHIFGDRILDDAYAVEISAISATQVNFFLGTQLSSGTLHSYQQISAPTYQDLIRASDHPEDHRENLSEIEIGNETYEQILYPLGFAGRTIGAVAVLYSNHEASLKTRDAIILLLFNALLIGAIGTVIIFLFADQIVKPLHQSVDISNRMADGDLTMEIDVTREDEAGMLLEAMKHGVDRLKSTLGNVASSTARVDQAADRILGAVSEEIGIATQQAASVNQITSTMEELSATSKQIAETSNHVREIANNNLSETESSEKVVQILMNQMDEINNDNEESIRKIMELGRNSQEITKVIDIISNIADQTKLIAFNASIEASVAGDAGRRFGVVALEIRRLAENVMDRQVPGTQK